MIPLRKCLVTASGWRSAVQKRPPGIVLKIKSSQYIKGLRISSGQKI